MSTWLNFSFKNLIFFIFQTCLGIHFKISKWNCKCPYKVNITLNHIKCNPHWRRVFILFYEYWLEEIIHYEINKRSVFNLIYSDSTFFNLLISNEVIKLFQTMGKFTRIWSRDGGMNMKHEIFICSNYRNPQLFWEGKIHIRKNVLSFNQ